MANNNVIQLAVFFYKMHDDMYNNIHYIIT